MALIKTDKDNIQNHYVLYKGTIVFSKQLARR
jgi:hypothetical protein